jgi:hypothetical protein
MFKFFIPFATFASHGFQLHSLQFRFTLAGKNIPVFYPWQNRHPLNNHPLARIKQLISSKGGLKPVKENNSF